MSIHKKTEKKEIRRILFYEVKEALDELKDAGPAGLLSSEESWEKLKKLLHTLLNEKQDKILFLGAGTSMSIERISDSSEPDNPLDWDALIKGLFTGLNKPAKKAFLEGQTKDRQKKITEADKLDLDNWFEKIKGEIDKPTLTWYLGQYYEEKTGDRPIERNKRLYELVSEPLSSGDYSSSLLSEIVKLPFNDIITTNFDRSIDKFLKDEKEYRKRIEEDVKKYRGYDVEIFDTREVYKPENFLESIVERVKHRLFYIHGRADDKGENFLVFDKFDFAKLISKRDSILEYLIGRIINSTVIYFGFSLDDPTFNYIQERMRKFFGTKSNYALPSFSFSTDTSATIINAFEKRHISIISYNDVNDLPKILKNINLILKYFRQSPENEINKIPLDFKETKTNFYQKEGREAYIAESYEKSLKNYRLAMATLLFSDATEKSSKENIPVKYWDYARILINIRRHLVLNLSKLRWKDLDLYKVETALFEEPEGKYDINTRLLNGTIDRAIKLLEDCHNTLAKHDFPNNEKIGIEARKASLGVLKARIKAHEGNIQESYNKYELFEKAFKQDLTDTDLAMIDEKEKFLYDYTETAEFLEKYTDLLKAIEDASYRDLLDKDEAGDKDAKATAPSSYKYEINEDTLLLGYSYIFAREQGRRHKLFLGHKRYPKAEEDQYRKDYQSLIRELTNPNNEKYFNSELSTSLQTLADVLVIGLWEIGSRFVRYASGDLLPATPAEEDFETYIKDAIELFNEDEKKFKESSNKIPIGDGIEILPSPRWQTRMYRHKCRAYVLRWVKNKSQNTEDDYDLFSAFTSCKKALDSAEKANLRGELLKNCLESARMNTLVMIYTAKDNPTYAMSKSAGYYYLSQAVEILHELLGQPKSDLGLETIKTQCRKVENYHIWWLTIFILKIASYFSWLVDKQKTFQSPTKPEVFLKQCVKDLLEKEPEERKKTVSDEYREYGEIVMRDRNVLDDLIKRYESDFDQIPQILKGQ